MSNYDKETAIRLTGKQIEVYETMLSKIPAIVEIIRKFDGKQVTKRIETALQTFARGVSFRKSQYSNLWELTLAEWDNRSIPGEPDSYGYSSTIYVSDYHMYLADSYRENAFVGVDGKLNAEKLIAQIERKREYYSGTVAALKEQLSRIDEIIARRDEIKRMKDEFSDSVDSLIRDYFGLKV